MNTTNPHNIQFPAMPAISARVYADILAVIEALPDDADDYEVEAAQHEVDAMSQWGQFEVAQGQQPVALLKTLLAWLDDNTPHVAYEFLESVSTGVFDVALLGALVALLDTDEHADTLIEFLEEHYPIPETIEHCWARWAQHYPPELTDWIAEAINPAK